MAQAQSRLAKAYLQYKGKIFSGIVHLEMTIYSFFTLRLAKMLVLDTEYYFTLVTVMTFMKIHTTVSQDCRLKVIML